MRETRLSGPNSSVRQKHNKIYPGPVCANQDSSESSEELLLNVEKCGTFSLPLSNTHRQTHAHFSPVLNQPYVQLQYLLEWINLTLKRND